MFSVGGGGICIALMELAACTVMDKNTDPPNSKPIVVCLPLPFTNAFVTPAQNESTGKDVCGDEILVVWWNKMGWED